MIDFKALIQRFSNFTDCEFYPHQKQAISWFMNSEYDKGVLTGSTGSGKSLLAMGIAQLHNEAETDPEFQRVCYLVSSRPLQIQLEKDFPEAKIMWGRANFRCKKHPRFNCGTCAVSIHNLTVPVGEPKMPKCRGCPYELAKRKVMNSKIQILNYAYFLTEANYVGQFSDYPLIVADESDMLERHLRSMVMVEFNEKTAQRLDLAPPKRKLASSADAISFWKDWAVDSRDKVQQRMLSVVDRISGEMDDETVRKSRELRSLEGILSKMDFFIKNVDDTWIYQSYKGGHTFQPIWLLPDMTEQWFFQHGRKFLFMSATFPPLPIYAKLLGMNPEHVDSLEVPSTFPVENRKVKLLNTGDLRRKTKDAAIPSIKNAIRKIMAHHKGEKGIIHSVSYQLNQAIMEINDDRLMTHDSTNKIDQLNYFMETDQPKVFVSPSSTRGLDLKGDLARFNVLVKMPFQSLGDKLVAARTYSGQTGQIWFISDACQEIVQAAGRTNRNQEDFSVIYVLDICACEKIAQKNDYFPQYFRDAVEIEW